MSSAVEFPAASVLRHADAVTDAAEELNQARSAVREVSMDIQAYGRLCQFLPGLLSPLFGGAIEVMNDATEALAETGTKLRTTASAMEDADVGSAQRLDSAAGSGLVLPL
jgi:hypothetical protein